MCWETESHSRRERRIARGNRTPRNATGAHASGLEAQARRISRDRGANQWRMECSIGLRSLSLFGSEDRIPQYDLDGLDEAVHFTMTWSPKTGESESVSWEIPAKTPLLCVPGYVMQDMAYSVELMPADMEKYPELNREPEEFMGGGMGMGGDMGMGAGMPAPPGMGGGMGMGMDGGMGPGMGGPMPGPAGMGSPPMPGAECTGMESTAERPVSAVPQEAHRVPDEFADRTSPRYSLGTGEGDRTRGRSRPIRRKNGVGSLFAVVTPHTGFLRKRRKEASHKGTKTRRSSSRFGLVTP